MPSRENKWRRWKPRGQALYCELLLNFHVELGVTKHLDYAWINKNKRSKEDGAKISNSNDLCSYRLLSARE